MASAVHPERNPSLSFFARKFALTEAEILSDVARYNRDYTQYGNEVYEKITTRVAHWWNYESQNWFAQRVNICLDKLHYMSNSIFLDIGFSIPYLLADRRFINRSDIHSLLVDRHENVVQFYHAITELCSSHRQKHDTILVADIDREVERGKIRNSVLKLSEGIETGSMLVGAMEVIEHLEDDGHFWELLADIRSISRHNPLVYVTLPIGQKIPSHNLSFGSEADVIEYLSDRMNLHEHVTLVPPIDEFSPYLAGCVCAFGEIQN